MPSLLRLPRLSQSPRGRLTSHFFASLFDFGVLTPAGSDALTHWLLGAVGGLIAIGLGATRVYAGKYAALSGSHSPEPYRIAVLGDDLFLVGLPMLLVGLLTVLINQALFPDERDFRILGPLPIRRPLIFATKLTALFSFIGVVVAVLHIALSPLMLMTSIGRHSEHGVIDRLGAWLIASVTGCIFAVLVVAAMTGVVTLVLSRTRLHALTAISRSLLLAGLVVCLPFVFRLPNAGASMAGQAPWLIVVPPAWFVGLEHVLLDTSENWALRLAAVALAATAISAAIVAGVYVLLFQRFEHLLLRPPSASPFEFPRNPIGSSRRKDSSASESQACRGVSRFISATLRRSQLHQGVLLGLSACGVALALNRLVGVNWTFSPPAVQPDSFLLYVSFWAPFAVMFVAGISMRAAIALPMNHRANWIFQLTEADATRGGEMRAVDRVVTLYTVGLPVAFALAVLWTVLPPTKAVIAVTLVALIGRVFVHGVLIDWRRIPFTCSYMPGKRMLVFTLVPGFAAFVLFISFSVLLVHTALKRPVYALIIATGLAALSLLLRRSRIAEWQQTPLMFDDELPDQPLQLGL